MTVTEIAERPTTHIGKELPDISQYVRRQTSLAEVELPEETDSELSEGETKSTGSIARQMQEDDRRFQAQRAAIGIMAGTDMVIQTNPRQVRTPPPTPIAVTRRWRAPPPSSHYTPEEEIPSPRIYNFNPREPSTPIKESTG